MHQQHASFVSCMYLPTGDVDELFVLFGRPAFASVPRKQQQYRDEERDRWGRTRKVGRGAARRPPHYFILSRLYIQSVPKSATLAPVPGTGIVICIMASSIGDNYSFQKGTPHSDVPVMYPTRTYPTPQNEKHPRAPQSPFGAKARYESVVVSHDRRSIVGKMSNRLIKLSCELT
jgi:hypothetical protein